MFLQVTSWAHLLRTTHCRRGNSLKIFFKNLEKIFKLKITIFGLKFVKKKPGLAIVKTPRLKRLEYVERLGDDKKMGKSNLVGQKKKEDNRKLMIAKTPRH